MGISPIGGAGGVGGIDISGMDIETALMAIQMQRVNLLDGQLKTQMDGVSERNNQISKLNDALAALTSAKAAYSKTDANAKPDPWGKSEIAKYEAPLNDALQKAGNPSLGLTTAEQQKNGQKSQDSEGKTLTGDYFNGGTTNAQLDGAITRIKSLIDGQSNSQQTDMLRLQSMTNKRNEAFDTMTNFVKKMQDSRSGIIGNMR